MDISFVIIKIAGASISEIDSTKSTIFGGGSPPRLRGTNLPGNGIASYSLLPQDARYPPMHTFWWKVCRDSLEKNF